MWDALSYVVGIAVLGAFGYFLYTRFKQKDAPGTGSGSSSYERNRTDRL